MSLVFIEGHLYDVHAFLPDHPGNAELLLLSIGRDASEAFRTSVRDDSVDASQ